MSPERFRRPFPLVSAPTLRSGVPFAPLLALTLTLTFTFTVTLGACGPTTRTPEQPRPEPRPGTGPAVQMSMEPIQIVATPTGQGKYQTEAFSAEELFREGITRQKKDDCEGAVPRYEKLLEYFADSPFGAAAHYNLGLCLQKLSRFGDAARHFEKASRAVDDAAEQILALGAAGVNYAEAKKWAASRRCFAALLERDDLTNAQRLEARTRYGFAWFKDKNFSKAMQAFRETLSLYRKVRKLERLPTLFYVAMASYHQAAIYHEKFRDSPIRLPAKRMLQDLEQKATWMYKAQRGYWRAVKLKNHFWAMAAVYQVGNCYWEYRQAMLDAPVPRFYDVRYFDKTLKRYEMITADEQRQEYYRKLRDKTRILLRHAMKVYRKGLVTAERIGAKNIWVKRMQRAYADVKQRYDKDQELGAPATAGDRRQAPARSPLLPEALDPTRYVPMAVEL
jgi:tetratricopeptide (TPR) repeat protein